MNYKFKYYSLKRGCSNFSLLAHRDFDAMIITMHQSGTHWLKYMLTLALTKKLKIERPAYIQDDIFFGNPSSYNCKYDVPKIASSHSIPHYLVGSPTINKLCDFPKYLILVRDIRDSLVSNYEKWNENIEYKDFETFLRGDVKGKKFNSDIWWCIRFCNAWGRVIENNPSSTLCIKYEDLKNDTFSTLKSISQYLELELDDSYLKYGIDKATKKQMENKHDPAALTVIRKDNRSSTDWFSESDREFFVKTCKEHLHYDFGYDYKTS